MGEGEFVSRRCTTGCLTIVHCERQSRSQEVFVCQVLLLERSFQPISSNQTEVNRRSGAKGCVVEDLELNRARTQSYRYSGRLLGGPGQVALAL